MTLEYLSRPISVSMADDWYKFATTEHFWMRWRFETLLKYRSMLPSADQPAIDIGCGHGAFREQLENNVFQKVDGCDLNEFALRQARPGKGRLFIYDILEQREELREAYSSAFLMDVVEHIADDLKFLSAAATHVRPGGIIVLNVPQSNFLWGRYDEVAGHVRRYSQKTLTKLCLDAGLQVLKQVSWGLPLVPFVVLRNILNRRTPQNEVIQKGFATPEYLSNLVQGLRASELALPFDMPWGTSLLMIAKKPV